MADLGLPKWCHHLKIVNLIGTIVFGITVLVAVWTGSISTEIIMKLFISYSVLLIGSYIIYRIYVPSDAILTLITKEKSQTEEHKD